MTKVLKVSACSLGCVAALVVIFPFIPGENYNYIYPSIDTRFAPGFSEASFARVTNRMPATVVLEILGKPVWKEQHGAGKETWGYTNDGKCSWGDFAWLGREVTFETGHVAVVEKTIHYD